MTEKSTWETIAEAAAKPTKWAWSPDDLQNLAEEHIPRTQRILNAVLNGYTQLANENLSWALWFYRNGNHDERDLAITKRNHECAVWKMECIRRLYGVTENVVAAWDVKVNIREFDKFPDDPKVIPPHRRDYPGETSDRQKWDKIRELVEEDETGEDAKLTLDCIRELLAEGEDNDG